MKVLGKNVLIELEFEKEYKNLIKIPDSSKQQPRIGKVIACGEKVQEVQEGDKVLLPEYFQKPMDNKFYVLTDENHILGVIEDEGNIEKI